MQRLISMILFCLAARVGVCSAATLPRCFEAAKLAPHDVTLYVHVERAAALRSNLADRPIADWLNGLALRGDLHTAWAELARAAGISEAELFDACFGQQCTLVKRFPGEWAVIAHVDDARITRLLHQLRARIREPRAGMAISELPEQELLLARSEGVLIIAPTTHQQLLIEMLPRIQHPDAPAAEQSLANHPAMLKAAELAAGRIGVFVQHDPPMGGYSIATANLDGDRLELSHAATFANPPFTRGMTRVRCDFSPVMRFENRALLAMMQPTDLGDGPVEAFLQANLKQPLVSNAMRSNLGDRRMLVVGEVEGRQLEKPVDLLSTTFATCVEVKDAELASQHLDAQMMKIAHRLNALGEGAFLIQTSNIRAMPRCEPRHVDVAAAADWFTGGFPIMKNLSLNWTVVEGPKSAWFVIASHRQSLDDVTVVLQQDCETQARLVGKFDSCGSGNGMRIARHLRSWMDQAEQFAAHGQADEFRATLRLMSDLAGGVQQCDWQLARPSPNQMRLNVQIQLAPPHSADGQ